jgi:hypothetical protein
VVRVSLTGKSNAGENMQMKNQNLNAKKASGRGYLDNETSSPCEEEEKKGAKGINDSQRMGRKASGGWVSSKEQKSRRTTQANVATLIKKRERKQESRNSRQYADADAVGKSMMVADASIENVVRCFCFVSENPKGEEFQEYCLEGKSISIVCEALSHGDIMRCRGMLLRRRRMLLRRLMQMLRRDIRPLACAMSRRPFFFHAKLEHLKQIVRNVIKSHVDQSDLPLC